MKELNNLLTVLSLALTFQVFTYYYTLGLSAVLADKTATKNM